MDELSAATEGSAMDTEPAGSSGVVESTPLRTPATDTGPNDEGEPERPNSNLRIAEPLRGNESAHNGPNAPAFI